MDDVGRERLDDLRQRRRRVVAERIPGLEQLVAGAVELGQRAAPVGEAELDLPGEADGVLHGPHAGLLLQEEDAHHLRDLMVFAGFPTTTA